MDRWGSPSLLQPNQTTILIIVFYLLLYKQMELNFLDALKGIFGGIALTGILNYFGMSGEMLSILSVLLVLDFVFGVLRAKYKKEPVTSDNMSRWVIRKMTRWCIPFIVVAIIRGAGIDGAEKLSNTIMGILIVAEGYSILRHIYNINTGKDLPEIDVFDALMKKLTDFLISKWPKFPESKDSKSDTQK